MGAYERYGAALLRKAERLLQNHEEAQDVVQGMFLDMLQNRQMKQDLPYLYRALTNRCLNLLRNRTNRERLLVQHAPALRGIARTRCDDTVIGLDLLHKLLDRLDKRSIEILICRFVDDMPQEEIAQLLNTSRKTVGKRLQEIRTRVRQLDADDPGGHQ